MAKSIDPKVFRELRASGLRKRVARELATREKDAGALLNRRVKDLRAIAADIEDRAKRGPQKRSEAAKKAAKTRRRKAAARSQAAKKGARTRAKA
ncbi:MAG TPA: hypothetical protein VJT75_10280 [Thermoleophilaceae bacterium]|nr:hypothetical protein [Thermoleophilaceae bacterium]